MRKNVATSTPVKSPQKPKLPKADKDFAASFKANRGIYKLLSQRCG